jgi:hypothetical protein
LRARFGGKDCGFCLYNPSAEEVGGSDGFLHDAAQNFEVFCLYKYSRILKLKNQKPIAVDILFKAYSIIQLL